MKNSWYFSLQFQSLNVFFAFRFWFVGLKYVESGREPTARFYTENKFGNRATGEIDKPTIIDTLLERGAPLTCSFEEERRAMQMALMWVEKHLTADNSVAVFTDSQSLCMALLGNHSSLDTMRNRINSIKAKITIQLIPDHCGIAAVDNFAHRIIKLDCYDVTMLTLTPE